MSIRVNNNVRDRGLCDRPQKMEVPIDLPNDSDIEVVSDRSVAPTYQMIISPIYHQDKKIKTCRCCCIFFVIALLPVLFIGIIILLIKLLVYPDFRFHMEQL